MKIPHRLLLVGCTLLLATLACARQTTPTPSLPTDSVRDLTHDGRTRDYLLHVPPAFDATQPVALVMVFHGGGGRAQNAVRMTNFNELADEQGFIVVYPNGTGRLEEQVLTWNGGGCCGRAMLENVDDVGFARAILADLQTVAAIDAKRVYATGMSNGGIMAYRLACEAADVFAAIAPVAGTLNFSPCTPPEHVAIIHFHGTDDQHVLYNGGVGPSLLCRWILRQSRIQLGSGSRSTDATPSQQPASLTRSSMRPGRDARVVQRLSCTPSLGANMPGPAARALVGLEGTSQASPFRPRS